MRIFKLLSEEVFDFARLDLTQASVLPSFLVLWRGCDYVVPVPALDERVAGLGAECVWSPSVASGLPVALLAIAKVAHHSAQMHRTRIRNGHRCTGQNCALQLSQMSRL
jgi:hypothetical protein